MSGVSKEAAECRQKAAEFQEKANVASPEAREIFLISRVFSWAVFAGAE
jgi:hypothetical protein